MGTVHKATLGRPHLPGLVLALAILTSVLSCSRESPPPAWMAEIETVPPVSRPEGLDVPVRHQYEQLRARLDTLLGAPGATRAQVGEAYGELGMWHHLYRFQELAEICYRNADHLEAAGGRWSYYLGVLLSETDPEAAREALARANALDSSDVPTLVRLGEVELALGRAREAEDHFRAALVASPGQIGALSGLGAAALARKDYAGAVSLLEQVLSEQPDASKIHHWLGLAYRGLGETEQASSHFAKVPSDRAKEVPILWPDPLLEALTGKVDGVRVHRQRAQAAARRGDLKEALREHELAAAARPDDSTIWVSVAQALAEAGKDSEARDRLREALRLDPASSQAHALLGQLLARDGDLEQGETHLREALRLDPNRAEFWDLLGKTLARGDRFEESVAVFEKAIVLDPASAEKRASRALALLRVGRHEEALRALNQDLSTTPGDAPLELLLARTLAASPIDGLRDPARALHLAAEVVRKRRRDDRPTSDEPLLDKILREAISVDEAETLAMAHAENGNFERAAAWQRAALDAAEAAFPGKRAVWARDRLALYEERKPCRRPVEREEALLKRVRVSPPADPILTRND